MVALERKTTYRSIEKESELLSNPHNSQNTLDMDSSPGVQNDSSLDKTKLDAALARFREIKLKKAQSQGLLSMTPILQIIFLWHLFFSRKFFVHRITGLAYLLQFGYAFYLYFADYNRFSTSHLYWTLPLTGVIQSLTAIFTFTFLPKKTSDPGYYSDRGVLSYNFVKENSFYSLLLFFQWIYYNDTFFQVLKDTVILELAWVFFPYYLRIMWPKTSFRSSLENNKRNTSEQNRSFFVWGIWITKAFYLWAKHYIGYFLNYLRFLELARPKETYHIHLLLLFSAFATTISMFLHTLKFKRYMGPVTSFLMYQISYMATFYTYVRIGYIFTMHWGLSLIVLLGLLANILHPKGQYIYQMLVCIGLCAVRYEVIDIKGLL